MKSKSSRILSGLLSAAILFGSCLPSLTHVQAAETDQSFTISSQTITGETNKFSYYPEEKWKRGPTIQEYYTAVDTRAEEDPSSIYYTVEFYGSGIELFGFKAPRHSIYSVSLDGGEPVEVDAYNATRTSQPVRLIQFDSLGANENHVLRVAATGRTNPNAQYGSVQVSHAVVTYAPDPAEDIVFESEALTLPAGSSRQLTYTAVPAGSIVPDLRYASSNEAAVQVNDAGLLTAVAPGAADITASSEQCGITKTLRVTVTAPTYDLYATIVEPDTHYTQDRYDEVSGAFTGEKALWSWKNDKAVSEIVILSRDKALSDVTVTPSDFVSGENRLAAEHIKPSFIKEVSAFIGHAGWNANNPDHIMPTGPKENFPEVIYSGEPMKVDANRVQPVWIDFEVPKDTPAGTYQGTLTVSSSSTDETVALSYTLEVIGATQPDPMDYSFDVDYWQHPYNSAYYYNVEPFSDEHLEILRSHMELYKSLGGHSVTATIVEDAWGGQTYGPEEPYYPSMVKWTKKTDGSWSFDYTAFDKWIQLNKDIGIADQIVCYSMLPWNGRVAYFDEATGTEKSISADGSNQTAYRNLWLPFLEDFVAHLDEKGWFDSTAIGYDERSNMAYSFQVINEVKNKDGKSLKKIAAFNNFTSNVSVFDQLDYASVNQTIVKQNLNAFRQQVDKRRANGQATSIYTGGEQFPNNLIISMPAESYWTIMYAGSLNCTGFLRWAFDAWMEDPLEDATHWSFPAGGPFLIYPDEQESENKQSKLSVRLARIDEGVRDINKLYLMREEFSELEDDVNALFSTVRSDYSYKSVSTPSDWAVAGRDTKWADEASSVEIPRDVAAFKEGVRLISQKYAELKKSDPSKSAAITGRVTDETGAPVAGAEISLLPQGGGTALLTALSDEYGGYAFENVPYASYLVFAQKDGKASQEETITVDQEEISIPALVITQNAPGPQKVDKSTLNIVIGLAEAHVANGDTDRLVASAKAKFDAVLQAAKEIYGDENATQGQVDQAWKALMSAIQGLSFEQGGKTELIELLAEMSGVDLAAYEDGAEKDAFLRSLEDARAVEKDDDALASDVAKAMEDLQTAFEALVPLPQPGDKSMLEDAVATAKSYDQSMYVQDGNLTAFNEVLARAEAMCRSGGQEAQDEIDAMRFELLGAMSRIRLRADKDNLIEWLEKLKAIDLNGYSEELAGYVKMVVERAESLAAQDLGRDQNAMIEAAVGELQAAYARFLAEDPAPEPEPSSGPNGGSSRMEGSSGDSSSGKTPHTVDGAPLAATAVLALAAAGALLLCKKQRK